MDEQNYAIKLNPEDYSMELLKNNYVYRYSTRNKDDLRFQSVKQNWGKQRTYYHAFKDWNTLDRDLRT